MKLNLIVEATTSYQIGVDGKIVMGGFSDLKQEIPLTEGFHLIELQVEMSKENSFKVEL